MGRGHDLFGMGLALGESDHVGAGPRIGMHPAKVQLGQLQDPLRQSHGRISGRCPCPASHGVDVDQQVEPDVRRLRRVVELPCVGEVVNHRQGVGLPLGQRHQPLHLVAPHHL